MNIDFKIEELPERSKTEDIILYLEGLLKITVNEKVFFEVHYFLLVEFGLYVLDWLQSLNSGDIKGFYYETMESEEHPILELKVVDENKFSIRSVWEKNPITEFIDKTDVINAFETYVEELNAQLINYFNKDLYKIRVENS